MKADVEGGADLEALLDYLRRTHGFDFTAYKRSSLMRRVGKRMRVVSMPDYGSYLDYLEVHPDEFGPLFDTILINVTAFFRDPPAWEYVAAEIVPRITSAKRSGEGIRVWSAACASGEEAYSLAILLAEALGPDQFREQVRIYATDLDDDALNKARQATYTHKELANLAPELVEKYFEHVNDRYAFRKDLRRAVIFGRHDLIQDAPISRIDLLVCRNTLMYLNSDVQTRILARFYFSIADRGFLFLGKAEMLLTHAQIFTPVDLRWRVFSKALQTNMRDRLLLMTQGGREEPLNHIVGHAHLRDAAIEADPLAQLLVDANGNLVLANERARVWFGIGWRDVGRPLSELEVSYRPVELRSLIEQATSERRTAGVKEVAVRNGSEERWLDVTVLPLVEQGEGSIGAKVLFTDVTHPHQLQEQIERSQHEIETTNEELQSTNEELETTNEELQSTNEELETTNEELQSTNEELETMNEELQSTNEELETVNDELRQRSGELRSVNVFQNSILTSLNVGVVVVDGQLNVRVWNRRAEDLWGLRSQEVEGQNFLALDIGLPVGELRHSIRRCLAGEEPAAELALEAVNRRGKNIQCRVTCTPLLDGDGIRGGILLMEVKSPDDAAAPS